MMWRAPGNTALVVPWSGALLGAAAAVAGTTDLPLGPVLAALCLTVAEVLMLTAVAMFFSAFSTPFLTALFSFGVWMVGRSADSMATMKSDAIPPQVQDALKQLVKVWPNFNLFVPGRHTLEAQLTASAGPLSYVANGAVYSLGYSFILLVLAAAIFQRRDFL
jgi:ABC-type transport system involved in multi-copper enzyme maturation permease subunit